MQIPTRTLRRALRAISRKRTFRFCRSLPPGGRLHVACGDVHLDGWINIDKFPTAGADHVVDVRYGLPFRELAAIFAEHFIEHLSYEEGVAFLKSCRDALSEEGVLRLSTPNLDWVYLSHYHPNAWSSDEEPVRDCFDMNKAFRGWGHQFLYNLPALTAVLHDCGFERVQSVEYGVSSDPRLHGLERHPKSVDLPGVSHVLVVEAGGRGRNSRAVTATFAADYLNAYRAR